VLTKDKVTQCSATALPVITLNDLNSLCVRWNCRRKMLAVILFMTHCQSSWQLASNSITHKQGISLVRVFVRVMIYKLRTSLVVSTIDKFYGKSIFRQYHAYLFISGVEVVDEVVDSL